LDEDVADHVPVATVNIRKQGRVIRHASEPLGGSPIPRDLLEVAALFILVLLDLAIGIKLT
jgi:hypothetical protein